MTSLVSPNQWLAYFETNSVRVLPLEKEKLQLERQEYERVARSLQCFQMGEASEGRGLLKKAREYAKRSGDTLYPEILSYLVREENRHSAYLLHFMKCHSIPKLKRTWTDSVFRWVRNLAGIELSVRVLVTAETMALAYYRALSTATRSPLLREMSARIEEEEKAHVKFQWLSISRMNGRKGALGAWLADAAHTLFLLGTSLVVWFEHRSVLKTQFSLGSFVSFVYRKHLRSMIYGRKLLKSKFIEVAHAS